MDKNRKGYGWIVAGALACCLVMGAGCDRDDAALEQEEPLAPGAAFEQDTTIRQPALQELTMGYTAAQVAEIRKKADLDARAMAIDGVLSVGVAGEGPDNAWIQILCLNDSAAARARAALGDSLDGVPIRYALSDTIRAQ